MKSLKKRSFPGISLQKLLIGFSTLMVIPFVVLVMYLLDNINKIGNSYNTIVQNITQVNEFNLVFKEEMDSVMYMMVAHSLSKYEVKAELDMRNPDELISEAERAFENVRRTTVSPDALQRVKSTTKLLITLHKRVNDISSTVKQTG